jgi:tRNA (guanine-N7-)-methyltransferase
MDASARPAGLCGIGPTLHTDRYTARPAPQRLCMTAPKSPLVRTPIRSFVLRAGRLGPGQQRALEDLGPRFVLPYTPAPADWNAAFGRSAPRILEIGFGMGDATAQVAAAAPGTDFIGIEVHQPGVGALLKRIGEMQLSNIRILRHDAVEVLQQMVPSGTLAGVHVWFPDPWHKKRHHKRRLIQPAFAALVASRLAPGGYLHCATDWQHYAEQMLEVLSAEPALTNQAQGGGYVPRPAWRPLTKFENRGLQLGHGVWDLLFSRAS